MTSDDDNQQQLVGTGTLPTRVSGERADWEALGFTFGAQDPADPLFTTTMLPLGWSREHTQQPMWQVLRDEHDRIRARIFYNASPSARHADMHLETLHAYIEDRLGAGEQPVLDETWATPAAVRTECRAAMKRQTDNIRALTGSQDCAGAIADHASWYYRYAALAAQMDIHLLTDGGE